MKLTVASLVLLIAVLAIAGLSIGEQTVPLSELVKALTGDAGVADETVMIVRDFRLPRILAGLLVGMALAISGALTQTVMRNPLAEPGLLGINAGAALAMLASLVVLRVHSAQAVALAAFSGGICAALAIWLLSWRGGARSIRIILIGIGISALCSAAASFITVFGDVTAVQQAQMWLAGTLFLSDWDRVVLLTVLLVPAIALSLCLSRELDLTLYGEDVAAALGQRGQIVQASALLIAVMLSALAVSTSGLIGFVGLAAPHIARALAGHAHIRLLPVTALTGSALVMAADILARTAIAPAQLPVGLVTGLIGAPVFFWIFWKMRNAAA